MMPNKSAQAFTSKLLAFATIALTAFLAHFLYFRSFGLYEDDYWSIATAYDWDWSRLKDQAVFCFTQWPQGRPLNHFLPALLAFVGARTGGLPSMYLIGALWLAVNGYLAFRIAANWLPAVCAIVVGVFYVLFPADTTHELLIHVAHVQGAMTFLLLALLLFFRGGYARWAAYPIASLCLMSYETSFLPFLAAPLLTLSLSERGTWRRLIAHGCACALIVVLIATVRYVGNDSRAAAALANPAESIWRSFSSLYLGPATCVRAYVHAIWEGVAHLDATGAGISLGILVSVLLASRSCMRAGGGPERDVSPLLWGALATWAGAYALTLINYPPTYIMGRFTSVHTASAWPVALACGCGACLLRRSGSGRRIAILLVAVCTLALVSYSLFLQREYIAAWNTQKHYWNQILRLAPDAEPGVAILAQSSGSTATTPVIAAGSWADYYACRLLFEVRAGDVGVDFGSLTVLGPLLRLSSRSDGIEWTPRFWTGETVRADSSNLILFHAHDGLLERVTSLETPTGSVSTTRPIPPPDSCPRPRARLLREVLDHP